MPESGPNTNTTMDVYLDFMCSDSTAQFPPLYNWWLNGNHTDWLKMVIHIFPLP
ncbi:MAG: hypothetical protein V2I33_19250 [Kangiellaceae bacterium]|nr:hypothetical protein [Kangiellaceae bacterium]